MQLKLNDKVKLKKQHPCGGYEWIVVRTGSDYKLQCVKCGKIILISSTDLKKNLKL